MTEEEVNSLGLQAKKIYIDATVNGNWARFVNTSHTPNCKLENCIIQGYWIPCSVVTKQIKIDNEVLASDYGPELYTDLDGTPEECKCGETNCGGFVGITKRHMPSFTKDLYQMLKEEKNKTRDIEKDGQLFVTARKKLSTNQMPCIAKTLFQKILDEKKNKKRDVKNERRRFVTARETLQE